MTNPLPQQPGPFEKMLARGRHGDFVVMPNDLIVGLSLLYYGELYELEWQFMRRFVKPGAVVADIGAHIGGLTVPFAKAAGPMGRVHAFEPQPAIHDCLRDNVALNRLENVILHAACVGAEAGALEIPEPDYAAPGNFSGVPFAEEGYGEIRYSATRRIQARCVKLDDALARERLDFVKIDVEGMELDVLKGGETLLRRHQPPLFVENNRPGKSPALIGFLQALGYRMWWHTGAVYNPNNFNRNAENIFGRMHNINMICVARDADAARIPASLRPVAGVNDHVKKPQGVMVSTAGDVTGI